MGKKTIAIIVVALLVIAGGGFAAFHFLGSTPKNTYLLSEQETAKQFSDYYEKRFENEVAFQEKLKNESYHIKGDVTADVPESLLSAMDLPKSVVDTTKIVFDVAHDPKEKKSLVSVAPTIADNEIGKFQLSADKAYQYIETPLFKDILKIKNDKLADVAEEYGLLPDPTLVADNKAELNKSLNLNNTLSKSQVSEEEVSKLFEKYTKVIIDKLEDDNFEKSKEEVSIFGEKQKLEKISMKLSSKDTKSIVLAVLEEAKSDKDLQSLVEKQASVEDFDKEIKKAIEETKSSEVSNFPEIKSDIYQDKHLILKRKLSIKHDGQEFVVDGKNLIEDDKLRVDYNVTAGQGTMKFEGESVEKDGKFKDGYTFDMPSSDIKVAFNNTSKTDGDKRKDKATVKATISGVQHEVKLDNELNTDTKNNTQKQKLVLGVDAGEPVNFILNFETKLKEDVKFKTEGAKDFTEMSRKEKEKIQDEISDSFEGIIKKVLKSTK